MSMANGNKMAQVSLSIAQRCNLKMHLSRSSKVICQGHNRKRVYEFLLAVNSNRRRRTHRLRDTRNFQFEPFSVTPFDPFEATAGSVALIVYVPSEIDAN
jgi:hypothetical protein